jgi:hypothetical protein
MQPGVIGVAELPRLQDGPEVAEKICDGAPLEVSGKRHDFGPQAAPETIDENSFRFENLAIEPPGLAPQREQDLALLVGGLRHVELADGAGEIPPPIVMAQVERILNRDGRRQLKQGKTLFDRVCRLKI